MTLQEYITAEFGIVPDEVQLDQIRDIVVKEYARIEIKRGYLPEIIKDRERYLPTKADFVDLPHMGFSLVKTKDF
jgi:hypothetical protein